MADGEGARGVGHVVYNVDGILDAHTHLTGEESADQILECMDSCGVEKAFVFAPMLNVGAHEITSDSLHDIRTHNDSCADVCSKAPERLLGFCALNPMPDLAGGDLDRAVDLMIGEAERSYYELGLRGAGELVATGWYADDPSLVRLWRALATLGMYTVFHAGIFYDGRQSAYCRPAYLEGVRGAPGFKGHVAHVGWPWYDQCIAMLKVTTGLWERPQGLGPQGRPLLRVAERLAARGLAALHRHPAARHAHVRDRHLLACLARGVPRVLPPAAARALRDGDHAGAYRAGG